MNSKKISILGAGKSGKSCARLALKMGYEVILSDISNNVKFENYNKLTLELGGHSDKILESDFIVVSPGISSEISIIKKAQKLEIPIISEIEFASWFTDSNILAVTGSNGKSTVVKLLYAIFKKNFTNVLLGGNIGNSLSENIILYFGIVCYYKGFDILLKAISILKNNILFTYKKKVNCYLPKYYNRHIYK